MIVKRRSYSYGDGIGNGFGYGGRHYIRFSGSGKGVTGRVSSSQYYDEVRYSCDFLNTVGRGTDVGAQEDWDEDPEWPALEVG